MTTESCLASGNPALNVRRELHYWCPLLSHAETTIKKEVDEHQKTYSAQTFFSVVLRSQRNWRVAILSCCSQMEKELQEVVTSDFSFSFSAWQLFVYVWCPENTTQQLLQNSMSYQGSQLTVLRGVSGSDCDSASLSATPLLAPSSLLSAADSGLYSSPDAPLSDSTTIRRRFRRGSTLDFRFGVAVLLCLPFFYKITGLKQEFTIKSSRFTFYIVFVNITALSVLLFALFSASFSLLEGDDVNVFFSSSSDSISASKRSASNTTTKT